ncbi:voltage-gated potassium channel Kch [Bradyrhizobium sp. USDA 10063]
MKQAGQPFLVIEDADAIVTGLKQNNIEAIMGNAARADVLAAANPSAARYLVVAIPEAFEAGQIVQQARVANPNIRIIARAHSDAEVEHLTRLGADTVIMGEREIARAMIENLQRLPETQQMEPQRAPTVVALHGVPKAPADR